MGKKAVVIIPTYNERDNISNIVRKIEKIDATLDILVVDDNSPDGTGDVAESIKRENPNVEVMHRKGKEGLGPAYKEAFCHVLNKNIHEFIIQMDADFSHNPADIPRLLEKAQACDVVVGSRYVTGGGISNNWGVLRKQISKFGNLYARIITGLKVIDCTSGFKCYRKNALKSLDLNTISLNGYGFQIQTLYELRKKHCRICEIPIFFDERIEGKSKMNLNIVLEAFLSLPYMRIRDLAGWGKTQGRPG